MDAFTIAEREGPVVACALHAGGEMRPALLGMCALGAEERRREEDPHTDAIADVGVTRVIVQRSRFEVDLNRPREAAVYRDPADAWGLDVWREPLPAAEIAASLDVHDRFYDAVRDLLSGVVARWGSAVVLDVHSYNHRRTGPGAPPEAPEANPEVNMGTETLDTERWSPLVARVAEEFSSAGIDVRENVRFRGGYFAAWAHDTFAGDVAVLALEFKKVFMDEWSGDVDVAHVERLRSVLARCVDPAAALVESGRR